MRNPLKTCWDVLEAKYISEDASSKKVLVKMNSMNSKWWTYRSESWKQFHENCQDPWTDKATWHDKLEYSKVIRMSDVNANDKYLNSSRDMHLHLDIKSGKIIPHISGWVCSAGVG
nr:hypothetical protein Iba_chr04dCG11910 [Ipomoea batatas]